MEFEGFLENLILGMTETISHWSLMVTRLYNSNTVRTTGYRKSKRGLPASSNIANRIYLPIETYTLKLCLL